MELDYIPSKLVLDENHIRLEESQTNNKHISVESWDYFTKIYIGIT